MGVKKDRIEQITNEAAKRGFDVRLRDIAFALLRSYLGNEVVAWTIVFGELANNDDIPNYESLESSKYLLRHFNKEFNGKKEKKEDKNDAIADILKKVNEDREDITAEENKSEMVRLIQRVEEALAENKIDVDKGLKIIADIRVKLKDKFDVAEKENAQYVVVQKKYDYICPWTRHECYQIGREEAMEKWHLVPDPEYKQED